MEARGFVVGAFLGGLLIWGLLVKPEAFEGAWKAAREAVSGARGPAARVLSEAEDLRDGARRKLEKIARKARE